MSGSLSPRERVLRSLEGSEIDRVPSYFRAEPELADRLAAELGLASPAQLQSHFGGDAVHANAVYRRDRFRKSADPACFYDLLGNLWRRLETGGAHTETVAEPVLRGAASVDDLARVDWPEPDLLDIDRSVAEAKAARATGLAVYGGVWASIFTHARWMLGEEEFLVSMVSNPELIAALVGRLAQSYLALNAAYLERCAEYLDVFYFGSDFGTQDSLFTSPAMFRHFFKPHLAASAAQAKRRGLKVMYHTCGAVAPLIDDFIECGIDILDPVQTSASGMAPEELAKRFKGTIAFHGGISTQTVLPHGTPEKVYEETTRTIAALGPLGYIVSPDQDMIGDVPLANVEAMFAAARDFAL